MTSCRILSWPSDMTEKPIRLAGTCSRYSNSAMPQLTSAATIHGFDCRFFRCPYHANVINRLDAASMSAVSANDEVGVDIPVSHAKARILARSRRGLPARAGVTAEYRAAKRSAYRRADGCPRHDR